MPEIPMGLSLDQDDDGFVLRRREAADAVTAIHFSEAEFWGLKDIISLWTDRILARRQTGSGAVQPVVAHPVAQVRMLPDAVQENILLTVAAPSGEQMTLELPFHVAKYIADEIPNVLRDMGTGNPTRQ